MAVGSEKKEPRAGCSELFKECTICTPWKNLISVMKSRRVRLVGCVESRREMRNLWNF